MTADRNNDLKARLEALRAEGVLAVACPTCGSEAGFHRPFTWLRGEDAELAKADPGIIGVAESGGYVVELFPEVFLWSDPERAEAGGSTGHRIGVVHCDACGQHDKHRIRWPDDLFFRIAVEGHEMVAYTRAHAEDNLEMLEMVLSMPRVLRPFFAEQLEERIAKPLMKGERLVAVTKALRRLLHPPSEDPEAPE